jgi:hypothetical protein
MKDNHEAVKHAIDAISAFFALGAFFKFFPAIGTVLTIVWYSIRIWESETVKGLTGRGTKNG